MGGFMKNVFTMLVASAVSVLLVLAGAPASQAADTDPPELVSIQRTTADQIDKDNTDAEILVDARDASGIHKIEVMGRLVGSDSTTYCIHGGTYYPGDRPGPWPVAMCSYWLLGENVDPGTTVVDWVELTDTAGNTSRVTDRALLDPLEYRVVNPAYDNKAPTLVSLEVEPAVAVPGESVTVTLTVADTSSHAGGSYTVGGSLTADGVCCSGTPALTNTVNGDGTFTNKLVYKTSTDTLYGTYPLTNLLLVDRYRNEVIVPTDAAIVVDDPAHPVGDLQMHGNFAVGETLTAAATGWDPAATVTYKWYRSGWRPEPGPSTYLLNWEHYKRWANVEATGTWPDGTVRIRRLTSPRIEQGTLDFGQPTLGSSPTVGQEVALQYPVLKYPILGTPGDYYPLQKQQYQWLRDGVPITGAETRSYVPVAADFGRKLSAQVKTSALGYPDTTVTSVPSDVNPGVLSAPTPTISGTARVGVSLQAVPGSWTSGTTFKYQWQRNGVNISGATSAKYVPTAADRGQDIRVGVTGSKPGYTTVSKYSASRTIAAGILSAPTPTISGTPRVDVSLKAVPGTWTSGTTLKYQWQRNGVNISGATSVKYVPRAADRGKDLRVRVTGSKAGYTTVSKTSARVRVR